MRILPAALAISAVLHSGALAWVITHKPDPQPPQPVTQTIEVDVVPATVALLDDHTVSAVPAAPLPQSHNGDGAAPARHGNAAISTGHATGTTTPATSPGTETGPGKPHSSLMTMRHPSIDNPVSGDFIQKFLDNTKPLKPNPIEGERIADDIAQDEANLKNPRWIANASPDEVRDQRLKLLADREAMEQHELKPDGTGTKSDHSGFQAKVDSSGSVKIHDKPTFDATDALMRAHGMDPYASYKLHVLDETREERYQIGKRHEKEQLMKSAVLAQKNIDYLWAKTSDLAARKEGLFELWDDCAETGSDELVAGGLAARKVIVGTIRSRLTGPSAYTREELATLNAHKKSSAPFDPYAE